MEKIDKVAVSMIAGAADFICNPDEAWRYA